MTGTHNISGFILLPLVLLILMMSTGFAEMQTFDDTLAINKVQPIGEEIIIQSKDTLAAQTVFGSHELPPTTPLVIEYRYQDETGQYVALWILFSILLLSVARFLFPHRFKETLMAAWESRYFNQFEREGGLLSHWVSFLLFSNFLFTLSLMFYLSIPHLGFTSFTKNIHPATILVMGLGAFSGFYLGKYLIMQFAAWIFKTSSPTESYFRNQQIVNQLAGIIILPLLIISYYNPIDWILYVSWIILGILALYKFIRVSIIGLRITGFSAYHLILYLCTIEIAPVLFFIKFSSNLTIN